MFKLGGTRPIPRIATYAVSPRSGVFRMLAVDLLLPSAIISLGGLGLAFGLILAFASRVFHVDVDPRIERVEEALPGAQCGACGQPGCSPYAEAVVVPSCKMSL